MATTLSLRNGAYECVKELDAKLLGTKGTAGTGITVNQNYTGLRTVTIPLDGLSVTTTDATTNGAHGSKLLFTMPEGLVVIQGAVTNLTIARVGTSITTTASVVSSLGTVAVANTDATLTSTEANIIPSTSGTLTAGAGTVKGQSTATTTLDGTDTPVPVYLNFAMPDSSHGTSADALLVNGTITIVYSVIGDN